MGIISSKSIYTGGKHNWNKTLLESRQGGRPNGGWRMSNASVVLPQIRRKSTSCSTQEQNGRTKQNLLQAAARNLFVTVSERLNKFA